MKKLLLFLFFSILSVNANYNSDEFSLKNGLKIIMIEKKSVPIILFSIWYKCGSKCDGLMKSGVAHFLEHLAFLNHKQEFSNYLEEVGANHNAFTSLNTICFYEIFPKDCFEKVLFYESKRMQSLEIANNVFMNEKKAILEERGMRVDSDAFGMYREILHANLFNRRVGGISVIGWKHEIEAITIDDLKEFYKKWITPSNAVIILIGDFEKKDARQLIEKYFGEIPSANLSSVSYEAKNVFNHKNVEFKSVKNTSAEIQYMYKVPFIPNKDLKKYVTLSLALEVLEQSSFFIKNILKQMTDTISYLDFSYEGLINRHAPLIVTFGSEFLDNLDKIEYAWPYFRKKLIAIGISEKDLLKIKKKKLISIAYKKEEVEKISNYFGWYLMAGLSVQDILSIDDLIQSVTVEECNDILKEVFSQNPIATLKSLPKGYDRD